MKRQESESVGDTESERANADNSKLFRLFFVYYFHIIPVILMKSKALLQLRNKLPCKSKAKSATVNKHFL